MLGILKDIYGRLAVFGASASSSRAAIDVTAAGDNTLIAAPGANKQLWIHKLVLSVARGQQVDWKLVTGSDPISGTMQDDDFVFDGDVYSIKCGTNEAFILNLSAAIGVDGFVIYQTADV